MYGEMLRYLRESRSRGLADDLLATAREEHDDYEAALWAVQAKRAEVGGGDAAWATVADLVRVAVDAAAAVRDEAFDLRAEAMAAASGCPTPVRREPSGAFGLRLSEAQRDVDAARRREDDERERVDLLLAARVGAPRDVEQERRLNHHHSALSELVRHRWWAFDRLAALRGSLWVNP